MGLLDRIRVGGFDTNEKFPIVQSFVQEATDFLTALMPVGTQVFLEAQDENTNSDDRPLRHVFIDEGDGNLVNIAIVLIEAGLGLAVSYEYEPAYRDDCFVAREAAQLAGVGMWAEGASGGDLATWSEIEFFVNYDAGGDDFLNVDDEFIHIENKGPFQLDFSGWTSRKASKDTTTEIPNGTVLEVGESFRVYVGTGTDAANEMYRNRNEPFLGNSGDFVYLHDEHLDIRGTQLWPETIFKGELDAIVIDDVQYIAPGADDATNLNGEWVQIRNTGAETVDLTHWQIKDDSVDNRADRFWGNTTGILNNDGGKLEVWTPLSQPVDAFAWGTVVSIDENPRGAIKLSANFDGPSSDTTNPNNEWVALFNSSDSEIDLGGYRVESGSHDYTFASGTDAALTKFWGNSSGIMYNSGSRGSNSCLRTATLSRPTAGDRPLRMCKVFPPQLICRSTSMPLG